VVRYPGRNHLGGESVGPIGLGWADAPFWRSFRLIGTIRESMLAELSFAEVSEGRLPTSTARHDPGVSARGILAATPKECLSNRRELAVGVGDALRGTVQLSGPTALLQFEADLAEIERPDVQAARLQ
jgi:hypothetical protein